MKKNHGPRFAKAYTKILRDPTLTPLEKCVWLVIKTYADKNGSAIRPRVSIERSASGGIACAVHVSARSVAQARETAQREFSALMAYIRHHLKEDAK